MHTHEYLGSLIKFLEDKVGYTFDIIGDTDRHFDNRLKLQKYVFLAKYFGLDMGYPYTIYLRGPYSSRLAEDYYTLGEIIPSYRSASNIPLPDSFSANEYLTLIMGKDIAWLEVASTLLKMKDVLPDKSMLLTKVSGMKPYGKDFINSVLADLESYGILRV